MEEIFFAKSPDSDGHQETNGEHLAKVAELASVYGSEIGFEDSARLGGKMHDFGKYGHRFQGVLQKTHTGIDHAFCGAAALYAMTKVNFVRYRHVIEAISGHHDGLVCYHDLISGFQESLKQKTPVICRNGKTAALAGLRDYGLAVNMFRKDFPDFQLPKLNDFLSDNIVADMLHTRMLFSCVVDADYTVSAGAQYSPLSDHHNKLRLDADELLERLEAYRQDIKAQSKSAADLNKLRDEVYERCGAMGEHPGFLFTLTAPTGIGKTLALLHFALRHSKTRGKRRIIVVLPYLTLAEQNAEIYAKIIPGLLIDHSQSDLDDNARELAARWDAQFIITTSVKFFETLFANKPTDCRKLHNLADSVVIFDEAQSLPSELAAATIKSIHALCQKYRCTLIFSTATQPDFGALPQTLWHPTKILEDYDDLYGKLRRTEVIWRLGAGTPLHEIANEMANSRSVCAIVNVRRHARELYRKLKALRHEDEVFFLTTDLCPAHRSEIVGKIQERLRIGLPCRLVATQCIEAGVDLDFDRMYRALAPLEAIIQAAGRCNRNGRLQTGTVIVFEPEDEKDPYPGSWYRKAALLVKALLSGGELDIHNPTHIDEYYKKLFSDAAEKEELSKAIESRDFKAVDSAYCLIEKQGVRVIVPYDKRIELYEEVCKEARERGMTAALMRKAAPITVSTFDEASAKSICERVNYRTKKNDPPMPSEYLILSTGLSERYADDMGLQWGTVKPEDFILC